MAALVGDRVITLEQVDAKGIVSLPRAYESVYYLRKNYLEEAIEDALLELEAEARGIPKYELVQTEILSKKQQVTDEDVFAWYNDNLSLTRAQGFESFDPEAHACFARKDVELEAREALLTEIRQRVPVRSMLEAPSLELAIPEQAPARGPASASVTIVEFADFQCPYSAKISSTLEQVRKDYGDEVRIVWRNFPLPTHGRAHQAAQAAHCAHEQGRFWEYHDELFANHEALGLADLKQHAARVGLNAERFDACLDSGKYKQQVDEELAAGLELGIRGTPTLFTNGRPRTGALSYDILKAFIEEELESKVVARSGDQATTHVTSR